MSKHLFHYTKQEEFCPDCGSLLQIKQGKKGLFLGCSSYPRCNYLRSLQPYIEPKIIKDLAQSCPECNHLLQLKQGHFGMFIGCSHYPECHFVVHENNQDAEQLIDCPECIQGQLVARIGHRGKTFYGCNRFPKCKFTLSTKPYLVSCPCCQSKVATLKKETETHYIWLCANKSCYHNFETSK